MVRYVGVVVVALVAALGWAAPSGAQDTMYRLEGRVIWFTPLVAVTGYVRRPDRKLIAIAMQRI